MTLSLQGVRRFALFTSLVLLAGQSAWAQDDQPKRNTESPRESPRKSRKKKGEAAKAVEVKPVEVVAPPPEDTFGPSLPPPVDPNANVIVKPARKKGWGHLMAGARVGGLFAEPFSPLGASFLVGLEIGYLLPPLPVVGEGFGVTFDVSYTQPEASGNATDVRIGANSGNYQWSLTQRETIIGLTILYRVQFVMEGKLVPYLGIGPRIFLLQSASGGQAGVGNPIPGYNENATQAGIGVPLGADYKIGPGRVFLEALLLYAPLQTNITGSSNLGSLSIDAGYRFVL